ncbi:MAG: NAD(P)-dependent alcohol dehydrogenase [Ilumatobacter sp.]
MAGQMMRAITYHAYGGPDVLSVDEVPRPRPRDDQILVRVEAAEASKTDTEMRSFRYDVKWFWLPLRMMLGVRRPRRSVLGIYFSGVVEAVGPDVSDIAVGDEVYGATGLRLGAYGEFVVLPAKAVIAAKPVSMTFAEAAAVPLGAINALHFLRSAEVEPGDSVLIIGAGGVIGSYGVQVARMMGGSVTGVDAAHKESFVRSVGATEFVDYQTTDVTSLDSRYDVIFDMVPSTPVSKILDLLKPGGRYAHGNPRLTTMIRARLARFTGAPIQVAQARENRAVLEELAGMIDAGQLSSIVDRVVPMEQASEAHRLVDTEQRVGAVVLAIGPDAMNTRASNAS